MVKTKLFHKVPRGVKRLGRSVFVIAAFVAVFAFGLGVGNGTITFSDGRYGSVSKDLPKDLNYTDVEELYDRLRKSFDGQLSEQDLLEGLKRGLVNATGDQYTEYLTPEEAKEFSEDLNGTFSGIGAELSKDEKYIVIVAPIDGFPAQKAGLLPKDAIVEIDGENAYDISVTEAVNKIRGPVGTKVKLKVIRGEREELDFEITRDTITIPSVESEILKGNIGYLKVTRFSDDTRALARQAANEFKSKNVKSVILDLRSNPGGLLDAAVDLSGIWLPRGKTVLQEKRDGVVIRTYDSGGPATLAGIPTVVLINEGSASASEITAGALKDNGAATLMGEKSFGKGSVQTLENLPNGGVLKVTIARWFTPNGKNIDKEGIEPDTKVTRSADDIKNNKDPQRDAALKFLQK